MLVAFITQKVSNSSSLCIYLTHTLSLYLAWMFVFSRHNKVSACNLSSIFTRACSHYRNFYAFLFNSIKVFMIRAFRSAVLKTLMMNSVEHQLCITMKSAIVALCLLSISAKKHCSFSHITNRDAYLWRRARKKNNVHNTHIGNIKNNH